MRPCPLCGGAGRELVLRWADWDLVKCQNCDMVFLGSGLSYAEQAAKHDWLDEYTKEVSRRKQKHPFLRVLSRSTRFLRPDANARMVSQTLRWRARGKLADFGCGDGSFLALAAAHFDVTGIELGLREAELSRLAVSPERILEGPVTEIAEGALREGSFDVVTQFGYLEHEWVPLAALRAAHRVLKPGGVTVIKTPNYACWNRRVMGTRWCGYHFPAHCNLFTPKTLVKMLRRTGFGPLPRPFFDGLPTSDSLWMAARKPA
jgi:2-polyprenyl-3-methyl-5-hydroxy-6-metoxy-1,4-benzoquinol methylase